MSAERDVVERLETYIEDDDWPVPTVQMFSECAAEIRRLRARVEELERANNSVSVCAAHTAQVVGFDGCLVCRVEELEGALMDQVRATCWGKVMRSDLVELHEQRGTLVELYAAPSARRALEREEP